MVEVVVVNTAVETTDAGYLAAPIGAALAVLYVGLEGDEEDWLYVETLEGYGEVKQGWFPRAHVGDG